ncbi:Arabinose efflux permease [Scardovia inopinata]|uniref:Major facilitator superfamily (MFS) profile domain-containing protein n=1 Tax=Scardovia inopinata F0304 TaxID=641146 RepID=W5IH92_SCAIO|nr:MFS transporter [Scardovia inopinata]EFG26357.1 hypothetical protein HMPREF9020_01442 [Scardovia inopinata F0304]BAR07010.1 hypothetical protein SCIP_0943 [Scardovia inopinata JCM 12537]SUV51078.1 Arabinose efflux permease [Scardovia inopinata]
MKVRKNQLILAIAVIVLELIGGMQSYVSQLILPIMSADFHAQHLYGLITGVSSIASMLGLPTGAALLQRYKLPRLLIIMTAILCGGSVISATSVNIWMYVVGQFIRGFAGSALAMASIGAVALGLSGRARQLTLALLFRQLGNFFPGGTGIRSLGNSLALLAVGNAALSSLPPGCPFCYCF